jgi:hypothetical protein
MSYTHTFNIQFSIVNNHPDPNNISHETLMEALGARVGEIDRRGGMDSCTHVETEGENTKSQNQKRNE